jgi:hypothetical protein
LGTVLVAAGLALLLVSLIPPSTTSSASGGFSLGSEVAQPIGSPFSGISFFNGTPQLGYPSPFTNLSPQEELNIEVSSDVALNVYLVKTDWSNILNATGRPNESAIANSTDVDAYFKANSQVVVWQIKQSTQTNIDYTPPAIQNITVVLSNPTLNQASIDYTVKILSIFAPTSTVRLMSFVAIPLGLILAVPWIIQIRKKPKSTFQLQQLISPL